MCVCVCVCLCVCVCVYVCVYVYFIHVLIIFLIQKPFAKDPYVCLCDYRGKVLKMCYIKKNFIQ